METSRVFAESLIAFNDPAVRIIVNRGGTRSGKTFSILQLLALYALRTEKSAVISIVTQTFPQLRQGAMRDFRKIIAEGIEAEENKSEHTFAIGNSLVEYFSADQYTKVLGSQRDILYINECNRLGWEVVRQLMVRTSSKIFFDYNPVSDFWINHEIIPRADCKVIDSTYKDNPHLSPSQVAEIEAHKHDKNWWRVYGLGLEGRVEGLVYPDWDVVDAIPEGCRIRYGIDFGYNDPTAIVKVGIKERDLYLEEICYSTGLISSDIGRQLSAAGVQKFRDRIIGDSAAAVQIEELHRQGWNIHPCQKGAGSIDGGIKKVKEFHIHVVKTSQNIQHELLNYTWEKDKYDNSLDVPIDGFNHSLDAIRYAVRDLAGRSDGYSVSFV